MAKSIAEKLLIKPGSTVYVWPSARRGLIGALPDGVRVVESIEAATTAVLFVDDAATATTAFEADREHLSQPAFLWICYPKGGRADINRDSLWPMLLPYGLRPITQIAIDDVWSALRFRPLAPGEAPFTGGG
jgi:hypothetical protein